MESTETRWQRHVDQGRRYVSQGNYAEAEQSLLAAVKEALTLGPADLRVASSLGILGKLKHRQGDRERAQGFLERALAVREEALGPDHYGVVQGLNDLAALHYAYGNIAEARALYERALAIAEKQLAPDHADLALALYNLSRTYFKSGDHLRAEPLLTRLLESKERALGSEHTDIAAILTALSRVRSMAGRHDEAEEMARRALAIRERALEPDDPALAVSLELAAYFCAGRAKRMRSLADAERILGGAHGASTGAGPDEESSDSSLEVELAALAAEEMSLRERARAIRSRSGGNREPSTLERSPAAEAAQPPHAEAAPAGDTAVAPVGEVAPSSPAEPVHDAAPLNDPAPVNHAAPVSDAVVVSEAAPVGDSAPVSSGEPVSDSAPVSGVAPVNEDTPVTDAEYIPAIIVPPGELADAPSVDENRRSLADSLPPFLYGRRARWFLGIVAVALLGAGGAGFALGRGARGPEAESLVQVQQASRGAIEDPRAGSLDPSTPVQAAAPLGAQSAAHGTAPAARRPVPRIPDWDENTPRYRRQARIPSRSHAQRMTRTMERLGSKVMTGVNTKVDSIGRTVELPPPTFDKP
ncbi:MAG TPA: tetratricopeptide repeat protein [Gemmatimonadaceae bacterium]|nr:tetratricopeptide repeat protein [Gemmatimonadaceae bacterium]